MNPVSCLGALKGAGYICRARRYCIKNKPRLPSTLQLRIIRPRGSIMPFTPTFISMYHAISFIAFYLTILSLSIFLPRLPYMYIYIYIEPSRKSLFCEQMSSTTFPVVNMPL